ncbi:MAG: hypothetical protein Q27BB25_10725 [Blastomonas sp. CACIA14H2]|nr:MAG: hypothetical protein Q27BB25_10725 [Blastomonas sp. CACIA14H2]
MVDAVPHAASLCKKSKQTFESSPLIAAVLLDDSADFINPGRVLEVSK